MENVSWNDIQDFIKKLNAREGHSRYRLPTEAEWEYAARAGSGTVYSFGDDAGQLENYAWFGDNSIGVTHPVGKKAANAWGLHDIHGNVWEWVQDWYGEKYYSSDSVTDPSGPKEGENRVVRGGNWSNYAKYCRAANRGWRWPDYHDINLGFRLALSEN